jgi:hypothetical protein
VTRRAQHGGAGCGDDSDGHGQQKSNFVQRYSQLVDQRPMVTKATTAGIVAALADLVSQAVVLKTTANVSFRRATAFLLRGALFVGPYLHDWCGHLHKMCAVRLQDSKMARKWFWIERSV